MIPKNVRKVNVKRSMEFNHKEPDASIDDDIRDPKDQDITMKEVAMIAIETSSSIEIPATYHNAIMSAQESSWARECDERLIP